MKKATTVKLGLGVIGAGIIGYGLYSMKKDTEKLFNAPGNFLDGLLGSDGILGGGGLPIDEAKEYLREAGSTTKSSFIDGLTDGLSMSLGLGLPPSALNTNLGKTGTKEYKAPDSIFETSKEPVTMSTIKKSLDLSIPMAGASPGTKYTEKTSSGNTANGYVDSTGRVYTPTETIKAKW